VIRALDSATPPTREQALAAKAAGVGAWWGYLATEGWGGSALGLEHVWTREDFELVLEVFGVAMGFCSGLDNPVALRQLAAAWGVRSCLDDERGIRAPGSWEQAWVDAAGSGLYGNCDRHAGVRAAFHVLALYPGPVPPATWDGAQCPRPTGPCGWQSWGTHDEFGASVDAGWYDDWFAGRRRSTTMIVVTDPGGAGHLLYDNGLIGPGLDSPESVANLAAAGVGQTPQPVSADTWTKLESVDQLVRAGLEAQVKLSGGFTVSGSITGSGTISS